eukprot:2323709-Pyramimonas_sp.AAC.2
MAPRPPHDHGTHVRFQNRSHSLVSENVVSPAPARTPSHVYPAAALIFEKYGCPRTELQHRKPSPDHALQGARILGSIAFPIEGKSSEPKPILPPGRLAPPWCRYWLGLGRFAFASCRTYD